MAKPTKLELTHRPRRLRRQPSRRALVEETALRAADLIAPLFVVDGKGRPEPIASMPGVFRFSIPDLVKECRDLAKLGIPAVALFPKLDAKFKDADGTEALNPKTLVLRAVRAVKAAVPELTVITDVALDPFTTHGQDGIIDDDGYVLNDITVAALVKQALSHAAAGADMV
ncbi:MAG TPA: porphobilinogen synthase, partial [Lacunisphaera sp.]|nr:porphobilinogen synthase [Lacunisphaera sp.]